MAYGRPLSLFEIVWAFAKVAVKISATQHVPRTLPTVYKWRSYPSVLYSIQSIYSTVMVATFVLAQLWMALAKAYWTFFWRPNGASWTSEWIVIYRSYCFLLSPIPSTYYPRNCVHYSRIRTSGDDSNYLSFIATLLYTLKKFPISTFQLDASITG